MVLAWLLLQAPTPPRSAPHEEPSVAHGIDELEQTPTRELERTTIHRESALLSPALSARIKVHDESGQTIDGAEVYESTPTERRLVGVVQGDAGIALAGQPTLETEFTAWANGYCPRSRAWREGSDGLLEIRLQPGFSIHGIVVRSVEKTPARDMKVACWPKGRIPTLSAFSSLDPHDPFVLSSVSDETGRFLISGLPARSEFEFVAGGSGLGTLAMRVGRAGDEIVLEVSPVYAASIELLDEDGGPLAISSNYFPESPPGWNTKVDEGNWIRGVVPGTVLAGLPVDACAFKGPYERTFVMTSRSSSKRLGPIVVSSALPGYLPNSTSVWAESLEEEPFSKQGVRLTRVDGAAFGDVLLFLDGVIPLIPPPTPREEAIGTLVIGDPFNNNQRQAQVAVYSLSTSSPIRTKMPAGTFTARYVARNGFFTFPPESEPPLDLVVGDAPAEVHLDLSRTGHLELVVLNQDSTRYSGPWSCGLKARTEEGFVRAGSPVSFSEGPYFLEGLPEGTYKCQYGSYVPVSSEAEQATFVISAGTRTVHVVQLER